MVAAAVAGTWEGRRAFHIHTTGKEAFLEKVCGKKCSITECRRGSILFAQTGSKVLTIYNENPIFRTKDKLPPLASTEPSRNHPSYRYYFFFLVDS